MNPIPIFIPFVNRPDLLEKAVSSVPPSDKWQAIVINNSGGDVDVSCPVVIPSVPLAFAQTQNFMLSIAQMRGCPFYLFLHSDAEAGEGTVLRLVAHAQALTTQKRKWGVIFTAYDALAAFNTEAFQAVGGWDTHLPWYFSDNDVYRRLRLAGYEMVESGLPVKHEPSQTIKNDPFLNHINGITFPIYARYYNEKWGGEPGHETFDTPFNGRFADAKATTK